jgi:hypothetical protein
VNKLNEERKFEKYKQQQSSNCTRQTEDSILPEDELICRPKRNSNPGRPRKRWRSRTQAVESLIVCDDDDDDDDDDDEYMNSTISSQIQES